MRIEVRDMNKYLEVKLEDLPSEVRISPFYKIVDGMLHEKFLFPGTNRSYTSKNVKFLSSGFKVVYDGCFHEEHGKKHDLYWEEFHRKNSKRIVRELIDTLGKFLPLQPVVSLPEERMKAEAPFFVDTGPFTSELMVEFDCYDCKGDVKEKLRRDLIKIINYYVDYFGTCGDHIVVYQKDDDGNETPVELKYSIDFDENLKKCVVSLILFGDKKVRGEHRKSLVTAFSLYASYPDPLLSPNFEINSGGENEV